MTTTEDQDFEEMAKWFETNYKNTPLTFPGLDVLAGIPVTVMVRMWENLNKEKEWTFEIEHAVIWEHPDFYGSSDQLTIAYKSYSIKDFQNGANILKEFYKFCKSCRFDKLACELTASPKIPDPFGRSAFTFEFGNVCQVCLDQTHTYPECGHYLCLECWLTLGKGSGQCPTCKKNLKTHLGMHYEALHEEDCEDD